MQVCCTCVVLPQFDTLKMPLRAFTVQYLNTELTQNAQAFSASHSQSAWMRVSEADAQ